MSTHFRPRPSTSGPPSPTRPSTARSTIRAISPSPPPSLSDALRLDLASTGTPNFDSQSTPKSAKVRPKSDNLHQIHVHGSGNREAELANCVATAEKGNFGSSPAQITANVTIKRGGEMMGRRSPMKRSSRSTSPKKRPYSTPTELSSHHGLPSHGQAQAQDTSPHGEQLQSESDSDANLDCPDTPTPMTNSQKRSAYLPLGTPITFPSSKHSSKSKSKSGPPTLTPATTPTPSTPKLDFFEPFHEQPSHGSGELDIDHPQVYPREGEKLREFYIQNERRKMRGAAEARAGPMERIPLNPKTGYATPIDSPLDPHHQLEHPTNDEPTMQRPEREQNTHPRMRLAPLARAVDKPLRKPVPRSTANLQRQVSISEVSHFSGGTVSSKRSVFITPGRDELERKKALIEDDEGPFAKAVSMADLNARRRVVSEGRAGDDRRTANLEAEHRQNKKKESRSCGLAVGCNVM